MRSTSIAPACTQPPRRRRLLLVGGFTAPAIVLGSVLASSPAFADASPSTITMKSDLSSAFGSAAATDSTVTLGQDLTAASTDGTDDAQKLGGGRSLTIDLAGKKLYLDQITIGAGATLSIEDTVGSGSLRVGTTVLSPGDTTGVRLTAGATFAVEHDAHVTAAGTSSLPGVGTTSAASTGAAVTITDGGSLTATGGDGAAGVGGSAPATITVDHATVVATGGSASAGIGGSSGAGGSTLVARHTASVTATDGAQTDTTVTAASAIGAGQGASAFGSVSIDGTSALTVPTGATLNVTDGGTITNAGTINANGSLKGAGTVANSGTIVPRTAASVDAGLSVTGNDYLVSLDPGTSGTVSTASARVLATSFTTGSVALPLAVANTTHYFDGWKDANGVAVDTTTDLSGLTGTAGAHGATAIALTASYKNKLSFSQSNALGNLNTSTALNKQLTADGDGTPDWSVASGSSLPDGVHLSTTGLLTGTPTTPGDGTFTLSVHTAYDTKTQTYSYSVGDKPQLAAMALADAVVGSSYAPQIASSAGTLVTYAKTAGALPTGLTLNGDGTFSGTPTASGPSSFTVTATNAYGTSSAVYTVTTHTIPVLTTTMLPSAVLGTSYSKQIMATGDDVIHYSIASAHPLPGRLTISDDGLISGTATRAGSTTVTVVATSIYGTTTKDYVFVAGNVPAITTTTLLNPTVGDSTYSQTLTTTGDGPITWSSTPLPTGLTLDPSTGVLSGAVAAAGSTPVTITSMSSFGTVDKDFTITAGSKPVIAQTTLGNPVKGVAFNATITAPGTAAATFAATGLPAGLTIDSTSGVISGTPTGSGASTVHVTATSVWGSDTATYAITVHVTPDWATTTLPDVAIGGTVTQQLSAIGDGTTSYYSNNLPTGVTLTSGGMLTATVSTASTSFHVRAVNAYGHTDQTFTIAAGVAPHITTTTSSLAAPILGDSTYSATVAVSGDDGPTFAVTTGSLPTGLHLDTATGAITGTATTTGSSTFSVTATSHWGSDTKSFTVVVGAAPAILTSALPAPTLGASYAGLVFAAVSGTGVTYGLSGDLPDGLSLDSATGEITGHVADDAEATTFTVTVHTGYGDAHHEYTLTPGAAAQLTVESADLTTPVAGHAYSDSVAGVGDAVSYAVTGGLLPDGLTLHSDGTITGTPTSSGAASFTVTATSVYGNDHATYSLMVADAPSFSTTTLEHAVAGYPYSQVVAASGTGSVVLHVQGDLPAGLSFDATTGTIVGTPTVAGTATITVVAVSDLATTTHAYSFTAFAAPAFATTALAGGTAGTAYGTTVRATGSGDVTYAVTSGSLPAGLALNTRTGAITGTPTTAGTATFTVTATSTYGSDSKQLTLKIDAAPAVVAPPAPAAPSLPIAPKATAELGHAFALSVAANSTVPVTYSVRGALPKGVVLNSSTGLISGTAKEAGTFTFSVTAKSSAGSDTQKYAVVVPDLVELVHGSANWITPIQGQPFDVSISGLQKGERWSVEANGRTVATGRAAKAGTVTTAITLKKALGDKHYTIRVSGSRSVTDPAKTAADEFAVTAITARKSLKIQRSGDLVKVVNLAPHEIVALKIGGKTVASGRSDDKGLFVFTAKSWSKGTHEVTATGKTTTRTGSLTVKITK